MNTYKEIGVGPARGHVIVTIGAITSQVRGPMTAEREARSLVPLESSTRGREKMEDTSTGAPYVQGEALS